MVINHSARRGQPMALQRRSQRTRQYRSWQMQKLSRDYITKKTYFESVFIASNGLIRRVFRFWQWSHLSMGHNGQPLGWIHRNGRRWAWSRRSSGLSRPIWNGQRRKRHDRNFMQIWFIHEFTYDGTASNHEESHIVLVYMFVCVYRYINIQKPVEIWFKKLMWRNHMCQHICWVSQLSLWSLPSQGIEVPSSGHVPPTELAPPVSSNPEAS